MILVGGLEHHFFCHSTIGNVMNISQLPNSYSFRGEKSATRSTMNSWRFPFRHRATPKSSIFMLVSQYITVTGPLHHWRCLLARPGLPRTASGAAAGGQHGAIQAPRGQQKLLETYENLGETMQNSGKLWEKSKKTTIWTLVGGLEHVLFSHILGIIIPID